MKLTIDLSADEDGYGYPALLTTEARTHEFVGRILAAYLEGRSESTEAARLVRLTDWERYDGEPSSYTVSANMWAGELGIYLRMHDTLDLDEELDQVERSDAHLPTVLDRHTVFDGGIDDISDDERDFVTPGQVMSGVLALVHSPQVAEIAARRDVTRVEIDLDADALVRGEDSLRVTRCISHRSAEKSTARPDRQEHRRVGRPPHSRHTDPRRDHGPGAVAHRL